MKFLSLTNVLRISILAFVTMFSAGSLSAEPINTPSNSVDRYNTTVRTERDNHGDWGWIGLLGLIGLAGLIPKNRPYDRDRSDKDTVNRNR